MGRKKSRQRAAEALDHEEKSINLRKFMTRNGFQDGINLKLRNFPRTGRGVACMKTLKENDVIISVPYKLMITYSTLTSVNFLQFFLPQSRLKIHDLLAAFLVIEKHKKNSFWEAYIASLPSKPPWIPALMSVEHCELLPLDLRLAVEKSRRVLEESWSRLKKSMKTDWTCDCCGEKLTCVLDRHSFIWGYVLVNTRAVYVNPNTVREEISEASLNEILSDEPCMALCPFLDMFNHSHEARTEAKLVYDDHGQLLYQLTTLAVSKKGDQIFISYGGPDNVKLLVEYGFFIPGNCHDLVGLQSKEVLKVLEVSLRDWMYKFIVSHGFDRDLFMSQTGASFNLKGLLFVAFGRCEAKNLASTVYNDNYPMEFLSDFLPKSCRKLLHFKFEQVSKIAEVFKNVEVNSIVTDFLKYRQLLIKSLYHNKQ